MAGSLSVTPTYELQTSSKKATLQSNYLTNFDFLNQYLPDTMEKEFDVMEIVLTDLSFVT